MFFSTMNLHYLLLMDS